MSEWIWQNFAEFWRNGWLAWRTWHFFRFLARRRTPAPKIEKNVKRFGGRRPPKLVWKSAGKSEQVSKWANLALKGQARKMMSIGITKNELWILMGKRTNWWVREQLWKFKLGKINEQFLFFLVCYIAFDSYCCTHSNWLPWKQMFYILSLIYDIFPFRQ